MNIRIFLAAMAVAVTVGCTTTDKYGAKCVWGETCESGRFILLRTPDENEGRRMRFHVWGPIAGEVVRLDGRACADVAPEQEKNDPEAARRVEKARAQLMALDKDYIKVMAFRRGFLSNDYIVGFARKADGLKPGDTVDMLRVDLREAFGLECVSSEWTYWRLMVRHAPPAGHPDSAPDADAYRRRTGRELKLSPPGDPCPAALLGCPPSKWDHISG